MRDGSARFVAEFGRQFEGWTARELPVGTTWRRGSLNVLATLGEPDEEDVRDIAVSLSHQHRRPTEAEAIEVRDTFLREATDLPITPSKTAPIMVVQGRLRTEAPGRPLTLHEPPMAIPMRRPSNAKLTVIDTAGCVSTLVDTIAPPTGWVLEYPAGVPMYFSTKHELGVAIRDKPRADGSPWRWLQVFRPDMKDLVSVRDVADVFLGPTTWLRAGRTGDPKSKHPMFEVGCSPHDLRWLRSLWDSEETMCLFDADAHTATPMVGKGQRRGVPNDLELAMKNGASILVPRGERCWRCDLGYHMPKIDPRGHLC